MSTSTNASPRVPRQAALLDDMDYEDKHMFPPSRRSHLGSPLFSRKSVSSSVASSVENSPAAPSNAKSFTHSPMKSRHSESELLVSPRSRSELEEYPRYESKKRMSADFSDDTMSVGSIGGESPKSDRGSWRLHSAVSGPFLTGPLAKDFQTEHLKTPRGKAHTDMSFDHSGLLFPLAPVIDAIPDTPRGGYHHQAQGFTDISQFENSSQPMDGFNLDSSGYATREPARPVAAFGAARRSTGGAQAFNNSQFYTAQSFEASQQQQQQQYSDGQVVYSASQQQSSAIVATQTSSSAHAPSYADVVARSNNNGTSSEQSLVAASASDSLESLSKGMADSMAQILAKTQNGRSYGEVQLTTLVQKIHMHMNIMGRTSAAIREDYNRIKAKLEQTITDKKVLEATNYHLQQLVQQYEVERQYFHQYVLHSLQSQSSLIYESMGNLSQNVVQSKHTIDELGARLSRELANLQGTSRSDSQLKEILEDIKRAVDVSAIAQQQQQQQQNSDARQPQHQHSPARSPQAATAAATSQSDARSDVSKASSFKLTPVLLAVLLWIATLGGVYLSAKSAALSELQTQQQQPAVVTSMLPSDLDRIVDQISQKLESVAQASEVRKFVYSELTENPQLVTDTVAGSSAAKAVDDAISSQAPDTSEVNAAGVASSSDAIAAVVPSLESSAAAVHNVAPSEDVHEMPVADESTVDTVSPPTETVKDSSADVIAGATVEPAVDAVTPVLDTLSDAPAAVSTPASEPKPEVVEIAVPPVEPFQVSDAAIAEMLRLNGFPAGVLPLDAAPSTVGVEVAQPSVEEPTVTAVAAADSDVVVVDAASKSDAAIEVTSPVDTAGDVSASATEPDVVVPAAAKLDLAHSSDASATTADVIEITIESALNPEVIVVSESPAGANTTVTAAAELKVLDDAIAVAAVEPLAEAAIGSASAPSDADSVVDGESSPVSVDIDAVRINEMAVATEDTPAASSSVDTEPVSPVVAEPISDETTADIDSEDHSNSVSESIRDNAPMYESVAPVNEDAALSHASAASSIENVSVQETASHVDDVAAEDDSSVSSVLEKLTSAPFTGLSMALRSLAHRLVESVDVPSLSAGDAFAATSEPLAVVDDIARRLESDASEPAMTSGDEDVAQAETVKEDIVPAVDVAESAEVAAEAPAEAVESVDKSIADASEVAEQTVDKVSETLADATESVAADASEADLMTVEVAADGGVAESADASIAPADVSEPSVVATDVALDELNSAFPSILELQVVEPVSAAVDSVVPAATDGVSVEDTVIGEPMTPQVASISTPDIAAEKTESSERSEDGNQSATTTVDDVTGTLPELTDVVAENDAREVSTDDATTAPIVSVIESLAATVVDDSSADAAIDTSAIEAASEAVDATGVSESDVVSDDVRELAIAVAEPADALEAAGLTAVVPDVKDAPTDAAVELLKEETVVEASTDAQTTVVSDADDTERVLESVESMAPAIDEKDAAVSPVVADATSPSAPASDADKVDITVGDATDAESIADASSAARPAVEASAEPAAPIATASDTSDDIKDVNESTSQAVALDATEQVRADGQVESVEVNAAGATVDERATATLELSLDNVSVVTESSDDVKVPESHDAIADADDATATGSSSTPSDAIGSVSTMDTSASPSSTDDMASATTLIATDAAATSEPGDSARVSVDDDNVAVDTLTGVVAAGHHEDVAAAASGSDASAQDNGDDTTLSTTQAPAVDSELAPSMEDAAVTLRDNAVDVDAVPATAQVDEPQAASDELVDVARQVLEASAADAVDEPVTVAAEINSNAASVADDEQDSKKDL